MTTPFKPNDIAERILKKAGVPPDNEALKHAIAEALFDAFQAGVESGRVASSVLDGSEDRERRRDLGF